MILFGNMDQGRHIGAEKEWHREGGLEPLQYRTSIHPSIYSVHFPKHVSYVGS